MQYMGGKHRQGPRIGEFVDRYRRPGQTYWEPFVGAAGSLCRVADGRGPVYASDICAPLVRLLQDVQRGWIPPEDEIDEETYARGKAGLLDARMTAFVGFGCSYGGKWYGGLARDRKGDRVFAGEASRLLVRRMATVPSSTAFFCSDYRLRLSPSHDPLFLYCDPPYSTRTRGHWAKQSGFSSIEFFDQVRLWCDQGHDVVLSEYSAPSDFERLVDLRNSRNFRAVPGKESYGTQRTSEGLWVLRGTNLHERAKS